MLVNCTLKVVVVCWSTGKGKVFPYSLPSVGSGADLGVQAVACRMSEWPESTHIHYALVSVGTVECMPHALHYSVRHASYARRQTGCMHRLSFLVARASAADMAVR